MHTHTIDVIMPCHNSAATLARAVASVLIQPQLATLWLVDDASADNTLALARALAAQHPDKIRVEALPENGGAARARNWGALQAQSEIIAFLDADDAYQPHALAAAALVFAQRPHTGLLRLPIAPMGLPERYAHHPDMARAWHMFAMTTATNTVFNRAFFLACGGFPQQDLFRRLGGEDGALGLATIETCAVATLFEQTAADQMGVNFYCRPGMHAERLFDAMLFQVAPAGVDAAAQQQAEAVTRNIIARLRQLQTILNAPEPGKTALNIGS